MMPLPIILTIVILSTLSVWSILLYLLGIPTAPSKWLISLLYISLKILMFSLTQLWSFLTYSKFIKTFLLYLCQLMVYGISHDYNFLPEYSLPGRYSQEEYNLFVIQWTVVFLNNTIFPISAWLLLECQDGKIIWTSWMEKNNKDRLLVVINVFVDLGLFGGLLKLQEEKMKFSAEKVMEKQKKKPELFGKQSTISSVEEDPKQDTKTNQAETAKNEKNFSGIGDNPIENEEVGKAIKTETKSDFEVKHKKDVVVEIDKDAEVEVEKGKENAHAADGVVREVVVEDVETGSEGGYVKVD